MFFILDTAVAFKSGYFLSENIFYPKKGVAYILANLPKGEVFSDYGWGGYLIWKLPQKKVFIDGRMPHWPNILKEFAQISTGEKDYQPVFDQYNIEAVLWPVEKDNKNIKLLTALRKAGWREVYRDKVSEILLKSR